MAVSKVTGSNGTAVCKKCYSDLLSLYSNSNCGRPLAACPVCRELYILNARIRDDGDKLLSFLDHKQRPNIYPWEWVMIGEYCLSDKKAV